MPRHRPSGPLGAWQEAGEEANQCQHLLGWGPLG